MPPTTVFKRKRHPVKRRSADDTRKANAEHQAARERHLFALSVALLRLKRLTRTVAPFLISLTLKLAHRYRRNDGCCAHFRRMPCISGPPWTYAAKLGGKKQDGYQHSDDAKRDYSLPPHMRTLAGLTGCRYRNNRYSLTSVPISRRSSCFSGRLSTARRKAPSSISAG